MVTPVTPTSAWRFLLTAGLVALLTITFGLAAKAQSTSSGIHFDVSHSNVTDSDYAAMQARARQAMIEKNHAGLIQGVRNGTAGQLVAVETAWAERDPSILSHYAGRWILYLALILIGARMLFR